MENFGREPKRTNLESIKIPTTVEEAIDAFYDDKKESTIAFLRANRDKVSEFCLEVGAQYPAENRTSALVQLSILIEELL